MIQMHSFIQVLVDFRTLILRNWQSIDFAWNISCTLDSVVDRG